MLIVRKPCGPECQCVGLTWGGGFPENIKGIKTSLLSQLEKVGNVFITHTKISFGIEKNVKRKW